MLKKLRPRWGYASVMATIAVFLSLGGSSYALIVNGAAVQDESLTGADVKDDTLTGDDILESTLNIPFGTGFRIVSEIRGPNAFDIKVALVECPDGKRLITGGYRIDDDTNPNNSGNSSVERNITVPVSRPVLSTRWSVHAHEIAPSSADWVLEVYAVCVTPPA